MHFVHALIVLCRTYFGFNYSKEMLLINLKSLYRLSFYALVNEYMNIIIKTYLQSKWALLWWKSTQTKTASSSREGRRILRSKLLVHGILIPAKTPTVFARKQSGHLVSVIANLYRAERVSEARYGKPGAFLLRANNKVWLFIKLYVNRFPNAET